MDDGLEVRDLSVSYAGVAAVREVSLRLEPGQCIGVLGANGAGKTTLLRGIGGLQRTDSRTRVTLGGIRLDNLRASGRARRGLGHVLEGRHVFPGLSVLENLQIGAIAHRIDSDVHGEPISRVLDVLPELRELLPRAAASLSGGQQQFLAVARAMIPRPRIMLLDEPTVGLAPRLQDRIVEIVRALTDDGVGVLLVEQNIEIVRAAASEAKLIVHGELAQSLAIDDADFDEKVRSAYLS